MRNLADMIAIGFRSVRRRNTRAAGSPGATPTRVEFGEMVIRIALSPRPDDDGRLAPLGELHDGDPTWAPDDEARFLISPLLRSTLDAGSGMDGTRGVPLHRFVDLVVSRARVTDCRTVEEIDERSLRNGDDHAVACLRRLRDDGADMLIVRGARGFAVAVVFVRALGRTLPVQSDVLLAAAAGHGWEAVDPKRPGWSKLTFARRFRATAGFFGIQVVGNVFGDLFSPPVERLGREFMSLPGWAACATLLPAAVALPWLMGRRQSGERPPSAR